MGSILSNRGLLQLHERNHVDNLGRLSLIESIESD